MGVYKLRPVEDSWHVIHEDEDGAEEVVAERESRSAAYDAAREARGDCREEHFRADGSSVGIVEVSRGAESIVLLRRDGSLHGELSHARNEASAANPHYRNLTPAIDTATAEEGH